MWSSNKRALAVCALTIALPATAAEDLRTPDVQGQRGQSQEQARRDRYECHNWAVEETGEAPPAGPTAGEPRDEQRELRRERVGRAIVGATIGGALGGIFGSRHDASEQVLVGAAAGAAEGAATARGESAVASEAEKPSDYLRALTACLEGRGYTVSLPAGGQ
jgi:hypothetical protein